MITFCPNCEIETKQEFVEKIQELNIRGEMIQVYLQYNHCEECGEEYEIPREDYDPLKSAYHAYRIKKGFLQPEEIKGLRKKYLLTQKELSELLGIGITTLIRYESGALQTDAHDQVIRMGMQPDNLMHLIRTKPEVLTEIKKDRILQLLQTNRIDSNDLLEEAIEQFGDYPPDLLSGFKRFDVHMFFQAMKFFCYKEKIFKTKLMKLLFYADFKHFKENGTSISGVRYAHANHGPVPDRFETWLVAISEWENQLIREEMPIGDYVGEVYTSDEPVWSSFSISELATLALIKNKFQNYTAKQIRDFSHQEEGYRNTKDGEIISYEYASSLQI